MFSPLIPYNKFPLSTMGSITTPVQPGSNRRLAVHESRTRGMKCGSSAGSGSSLRGLEIVGSI